MKKKVSIIILIILIIILFIYFPLKINKKEPKNLYYEILVQRGDILSDIRINGNVEPRNRVPIKPPIAGRIEDILVQEGQKVNKSDIIAWLSSQERATLLDIAKSQGEEVYKKWQQIYKPTPIVTPLDGFVIVRDKEPGQTVTTQDYIVVMADELIIKAFVDETDLRFIRLNQKVQCFLDAYPNISFPGIIEHISYEATLINNVTVYEIKIKPILNQKMKPYMEKIHNEQHIKETYKKPIKSSYKEIYSFFRSGMSTTIEIITHERRNILLVPIDAVFDSPEGKYVLLKAISTQPQKIYIKVGITDNKNIEVIEGLKENDIILISKQKNVTLRTEGLRQLRHNPMSAFFRKQ